MIDKMEEQEKEDDEPKDPEQSLKDVFNVSHQYASASTIMLQCKFIYPGFIVHIFLKPFMQDEKKSLLSCC